MGVSFADASGMAAAPKGISFADAAGAQPEPADSTLAARQFAGHAYDTVVNAGKQFTKDMVSGRDAESLTGAAKALAAGVIGLGESAASGISSLMGATVTKLQGGNFTDEFNKEQAQTQAISQFAHNFGQKVTGLNFAPETDTDKAWSEMLNLIPKGIEAGGDTAFDFTNNYVGPKAAAFVGAGSQALLTFLLLKPSRAKEGFSGIEKPNNPGAPPSAGVGTDLTRTAFDELAATKPKEATELAEHVEKADPKLAKYMKSRVQKFIDASDEDLGKIAKAKADAVAKSLEPPNIKGFAADLLKEQRAKAAQQVKAEKGNYVIKATPDKQFAVYKDGKAVSQKFKTAAEAEAGLAEAHAALKGKGEEPPPKGTPPAGPKRRKADKSDRQVEETRKAGEALRTNIEEERRNPTPETARTGESTVDPKAGKRMIHLGTKDDFVADPTKVVPITSDQASAGIRTAAKEMHEAVTSKAPVAGIEGIPQGKSRGFYDQGKQAAFENNPHGIKVLQQMRDIGKVKEASPASLEAADAWIKGWNAGKRKRQFRGPGQQSGMVDPTVFIEGTVKITKAMVEAAFRLGEVSIRGVPGVRLAEQKLKVYADQAVRTFAPEALGPHARDAGAIIAKAMAEEAQKTSSRFHQSKLRRNFWNHRMDEASTFINSFERGARFTDPMLDSAAKGYRAWNEEIFRQDKEAGFTYEPEDNYLAHIFEDGEKVQQYFTKKYGAKWGDPGFIKDRGFDLYSEALEAGYKPKYENPEDIMLARQHASDVAQMRIQTLADLERYGMAKAITKGPKGSTPTPEGFSPDPWRAPNGELYWVDEQANAVLGNAFKSKSLWSAQGLGGDTFRGAMYLKNALVPLKLFASGFHPLHVVGIDNAAMMTRASEGLLTGTKSPAAWLKEMTQAGLLYKSLYENPKVGGRLLKVWQGKPVEGNLTSADRQALQYMFEGGFIPELSSQYRTKALDQFRDAVTRGHVGRAAWKAPFALMDAVQKPLFEVWIPSLKIASYTKDAAQALKMRPELLDDPLARQVALRKIAKSVDNRYGEMAYNTLFWNKWVKDVSVGSTLSLGWNLGFIREYGGGLLDVGKVVGEDGSVKGKIAKGDLHRPMFVAAYTTAALAYGGLMTWAMSGKPPESLKDYVYPQTGEVDDKGNPKRVSTMFYTREFGAAYYNMRNDGVASGLSDIVKNKASPLIGLASAWATNTDSFGREISDPDAPAFQRLEQKIAYVMSESLPITAQAKDQGVKQGVLTGLGFAPAPRYATESKTEGAIRSTYQKYYGSKQTPYDRAQYSADAAKLKGLQESDPDAASALLDKMESKYELSPGEKRKLDKQLKGGQDPSVTMFSHLNWKQQKRILDGMTAEEREVYLPHSNKDHLRQHYEEPQE